MRIDGTQADSVCVIARDPSATLKVAEALGVPGAVTYLARCLLPLARSSPWVSCLYTSTSLESVQSVTDARGAVAFLNVGAHSSRVRAQAVGCQRWRTPTLKTVGAWSWLGLARHTFASPNRPATVATRARAPAPRAMHT